MGMAVCCEYDISGAPGFYTVGAIGFDVGSETGGAYRGVRGPR
jgi:hypothetical protein